jgi:hypothetical protein
LKGPSGATWVIADSQQAPLGPKSMMILDFFYKQVAPAEL